MPIEVIGHTVCVRLDHGELYYGGYLLVGLLVKEFGRCGGSQPLRATLRLCHPDDNRVLH